MNPETGIDDPSIYYYDSDYPSAGDSLYPENFDAITEYQGLAYDIERYREIIRETGGPVLELCCGTGRVSLPLARDGMEITAIDINPAMIQQFRKFLENEPEDVANRISIIEADAANFTLIEKQFQTVILAFNSLLCIPDFTGQCSVLHAASRHLAPSGRLLIDIVNPLRLKLEGDPVPKPFFTRKDRHTGDTYTRFAMMGPFEADHKQKLYGWYDQIKPDGSVQRRLYSLYWRPIFRFEIELMLQNAGLKLLHIEGGHRKERYTAESPRMFLISGKA
jgi:SAM-dependent methyltransferase